MKKTVIILIVTPIAGIVFFFQTDLERFIYKHQGLIGYDYGILSIEDLSKADKGSFPATPFNGIDTGYPYWQCFDKKYLKMECSYQEPLDKQGSSLGIDIETKSEIHFYSLNHAISGEVCDELVAKINSILRNQTYFCINGIDGILEQTAKKREYSWSFHRMKTKNGYAHYFLN